MVIDSLLMADQDESMNTRGRKRGFRIGVVALAAMCGTLLAVTALSGCSVVVVSSPRNPFVGEWHAEFASGGTLRSYAYVFGRDDSYSYIYTESTSRSGGIQIEIEGTYDYDGDTLVLTPDSTRFDRSKFEYEFTSDGDLELESQIDTGVTVRLTYHRHP